MKKLKLYLSGIWFSLPLQLLLLHFKRYQVLLIFWLILFATVNGSFLHRFGAHMLFLYPEYLGEVNALSTALVGVAVAVFMMSWNITTFILHNRHVRFLATTTQPFLKYCLNNSALPLAFLVFYFIRVVQYGLSQELLSFTQILWLTSGFLLGFIISIGIAFTYFFGADVTIFRMMPPSAKEQLLKYKYRYRRPAGRRERGVARVDWYLSATLKLRRPRDVSHYTQEFIERIFKQHHLAAVFSILLAFVSLVLMGYALDNVYFQVPAAASIALFFAILIAVAGAFSYFLESWTVLFVLSGLVVLNILYKENILDHRTKAYGLSYEAADSLPAYSRQALVSIANPADISKDSMACIESLNRWKARQQKPRPVFVVICVSGGGSRSATFTSHVLQQLDSNFQFRFTPATYLITGASGGMIGAAWYREMYWRRMRGLMSASDIASHSIDISGDLLNPIFSSFVARDLISPPQYFQYNRQSYLKDRGYAFERKLNAITHGWMDKPLAAYKAAEDSALIPHMYISTVITRDGRKFMVSPSPARFMMQPLRQVPSASGSEPDAVDFVSFFRKQNGDQLSFLSALRMNATFPYILPNTWLPTRPLIDVMDAGFRDNTGLESALKFLFVFRQWLKENTGKVVLMQIRDKGIGGWGSPYDSDNLYDFATKPALLTQNNLFRFQEYGQLELLEWFQNVYGPQFERIEFEYIPKNKDAAASLSFHLAQREKLDLRASLGNEFNTISMAMLRRLMVQ